MWRPNHEGILNGVEWNLTRKCVIILKMYEKNGCNWHYISRGVILNQNKNVDGILRWNYWNRFWRDSILRSVNKKPWWLLNKRSKSVVVYIYNTILWVLILGCQCVIGVYSYFPQYDSYIVEQELPTVSKNLSEHQFFGRVRVAQSLVFCSVFCRS